MRVFFFTLVLILVATSACNKDKFATKPWIEVKRIVNNPTAPDTNLDIYMTFTDREGDINTGTITYIRKRTNIKPITNPGLNDKADVVTTDLPDFTQRMIGEIKLSIPYEFMNEDPIVNDTMTFQIVLTDLKGNKSDTITTAKVVAKQQ